MDFLKLMKISMADVIKMEKARKLRQQANEIVEKLDYTKKEATVAIELNTLREKAIQDVVDIVRAYDFKGQDQIIIEDNQYVYTRLYKEKDHIIWEAKFFGITDSELKWSGKVSITVKELFELYKAEYLYENYKEMIPRDYKAYYERCYGIAGVFKVFANEAKVRLL